MRISSQTSTFTPDPVGEKADPVDRGQAWHPAEFR
jgi:hypothetical protein